MTANTRAILNRLSYVIYEHPDLEKFRDFAGDFGFIEAGRVDGLTFYRGYGKDAYVYVVAEGQPGAEKRFIGGGFVAQSAQDFQLICQMPGAKILDATKRPGGGQLVEVLDPNGYVVQVAWGQVEREVPAHGISSCEGGQPPMNGALDKIRKGQFTRMSSGPGLVHKLGHFGYTTDNYDETRRWYQDHFNFTPTDVLHAPADQALEVAAFMRVARGKTFVDHHSFLIVRGEGKGTKVHHSSFEVEDVDTQMMAHQWLGQAGWTLVWGVGRHVHGSQIFDYWYDSSGFIIEHYADGDLVNEDTEMTSAPAGVMAVWGPPVPAVWGGKAST
ncbi:Glyoxalase/fosfomycin resistance/dioxygenase [Cordyceps fumosorosea ARSEF 2679]|uniref:Glyoxalase/fosfomycin resistance/dioxygenase n=1 Tax=Cordyceps fumosorosea (strain ARSEF 2679) TaxID=1081104 RepID=A0A162K5E5_CORFA|nr:Glyoxalase/fosfomycin resistance/dioxygenase [Cordyceps fumosorosea ARSEF 2679]OAA53578.1 Glyoxalase/fosfomycin resistance/dioxygenase [Cordyceps fumosorosea ARSEF 2679]